MAAMYRKNHTKVFILKVSFCIQFSFTVQKGKATAEGLLPAVICIPLKKKEEE